MADAVPFFLILLFAIATAGILGIGRAVRPGRICGVVAVAGFVVSRALSPADAMAGWVAALHLFAVTGLAGMAVAGCLVVARAAPPATLAAGWRWAARAAAALLFVLILAATLALLQPSDPLGLPPWLALVVLPAEGVAGLCVWRGYERMVQAARASDVTRWSTWAGLLVVFALAGIGLGMVPVILAAGAR